MVWSKYEDESNIGSEDGIIIKDEKSDEGARITLEKDTKSGVPYAITCGIYGLMVHTIFLSTEDEAIQAFEEVKNIIDLFFSDIIDDDTLYDRLMEM